jgi:hypothetical protein
MSDFDDYVVEMQNRDREERAELSELREIVAEIACTEPTDSEGLCVWCCAGLTSGDEHSDTCHWLRARKLAQRGTH